MDSNSTIARRIAAMSWPQERSLAAIAKDLGKEMKRKVSRQYIHQVVNALRLSYIPGGIKRRRICKVEGCMNESFGTNTYCDSCIQKAVWVKRTGIVYKCTGCGRGIYRSHAWNRHGRVKRPFHNRQCYLAYHSRRRDEHSVLSK